MRIIAGKWRSRKLGRPAPGTTRPMPDRVREAIFNILGSRYGTPGTLPALHVADLFAGSGSMGLEALSRGAGSCVFYERDRAVLEVLRQNLAVMDHDRQAVIAAGNAFQARLIHRDGHSFDLLILDPPYRDSRDFSPGQPIVELFRRLAEDARELLPGEDPALREPRPADQGAADLPAATTSNATFDPVIVLHHEKQVDSPDRLAGWRILDERRIGTNLIALYGLDEQEPT